MADRIRYQPDIRGTNEIMNSPEMVALMREAAEKGKTFAESISPAVTGEYKASFTVEAHRHGGEHGDRAEAILENTARYAAAVEWRDRGGHHVLGKTADFIEAEYRR